MIVVFDWTSADISSAEVFFWAKVGGKVGIAIFFCNFGKKISYKRRKKEGG